MWDERQIGRRHRIVAQLYGLDPGQFLVLAGGDRPLPSPAHIERHQQMEIRIGMAGER